MDDKKLPAIAAEDIGKCAYGIFKKGKELIGKTVGIAGEKLNGNEMAEKLSKALDRKVLFNPVTPEAYRNFGFPGADDLGNMFQFKRDFILYKGNKTIRRAVERELEIIGEAISKLLKINPTIEISYARLIVDLRNKVIHAYDNVNDAVIWKVIIKDIPVLQTEVDILLINHTKDTNSF